MKSHDAIFCTAAGLTAVVFFVATLNGCRSVVAVDRAAEEDVISEGSVAFEQDSCSRERFEIVYERFSFNDVGMPVVEVGIRYRGGVSWIDRFRSLPKTATIGAKCSFYPTVLAQAGGPALYSTNRERLLLRLGNVYNYKAVCPVRSAKGYQLILGD